jgi:ADP-heptose:LPS heptosyltransferase
VTSNVMVLRALGLGDLLTAVPALRALRRGFPAHRITLAAPGPLAPLARLTGAVDTVLPAHGLAPLRPHAHPEIAVNLHGRGPQSHRLLLALHPVRLLAFARPEVACVPGPPWRAGEHEVSRWCQLTGWYGIPADPGDLDLPRPATRSPAPGATVVHPGAGSPARRWPAGRFAAVAATLREDGHRVVVSGGPGDSVLGHRVAGLAGLPAGSCLAGRTTAEELAALVAGARLVICGDTGTGHLATAYRRPSVLLFGPVPPGLWGPPPGRGQHRVLWAGRTGDPHGCRPDPGLLDLTVQDVVDAARAVWGRAPEKERT